MIKRIISFILLLIILYEVLTVSATKDKTKVTVFMCADSGNVSGMHELTFIHNVMKNKQIINIPFCQSVYFGKVIGKDEKEFPALAVTTGIGYVSSTSCTVQLLRYSQFQPTSIVFLGTSGFSPFKGGFNPLNKENGCDSINNSVIKNSIGSVCVTSGAFLMESGFCTETLGDNQCSRPNCFGFHKTTAINRYIANSSLVDAIRESNKDKIFPPLPLSIKNGLNTWWSANEASENNKNVPMPPHIIKCAESTINSIFIGAERDYLCREYTSEVMNLSINETVCVQAMESFGLLKALLNFPHIPVAIVRTASNYNMYPLKKLKKGHWEQNINYISEEEYNTFVNASFHYSIKTATFVVANHFISDKIDLGF